MVSTEHQPLRILEHLARIGRHAAETSFEPDGPRTRHITALKLLCGRGPQNQKDLAESLSLDPRSVVGLLNEPEERELITRRRDRAGRRVLNLCRQSQDEPARACARLNSVEDELFKALSAEERDRLYGLLVRAIGIQLPPCGPADDPLPSPT